MPTLVIARALHARSSGSLTALRIITGLFRGYGLSFLLVGRLVFRLLLRRLFLH